MHASAICSAEVNTLSVAGKAIGSFLLQNKLQVSQLTSEPICFHMLLD